MKATIELPDQLMAEVKKLADREQRKMSDLMAELVRAGIESRIRPAALAEDQVGAEQWVRDWLELADEVMEDTPAGPTARALLEEERNRLERG
jgi:hypothetical protein